MAELAAMQPAGQPASDAPTAADEALFATDEFRMYCYKVLPCARRTSHEWTSCPFAHPGEKARRRDPRLFNYLAIPCPDTKEGKSCPRGDDCPNCHSLFEYWLHPSRLLQCGRWRVLAGYSRLRLSCGLAASSSQALTPPAAPASRLSLPRYRTQLCRNNDGSKCKRTICFFAHSIDELRVPDHSHLAIPDDMLAQQQAKDAAAAAAAGEADAASGGSTPASPSAASSKASTSSASSSPTALAAARQGRERRPSGRVGSAARLPTRPPPGARGQAPLQRAAESPASSFGASPLSPSGLYTPQQLSPLGFAPPGAWPGGACGYGYGGAFAGPGGFYSPAALAAAIAQQQQQQQQAVAALRERAASLSTPRTPGLQAGLRRAASLDHSGPARGGTALTIQGRPLPVMSLPEGRFSAGMVADARVAAPGSPAAAAEAAASLAAKLQSEQAAEAAAAVGAALAYDQRLHALLASSEGQAAQQAAALSRQASWAGSGSSRRLSARLAELGAEVWGGGGPANGCSTGSPPLSPSPSWVAAAEAAGACCSTGDASLGWGPLLPGGSFASPPGSFGQQGSPGAYGCGEQQAWPAGLPRTVSGPAALGKGLAGAGRGSPYAAQAHAAGGPYPYASLGAGAMLPGGSSGFPCAPLGRGGGAGQGFGQALNLADVAALVDCVNRGELGACGSDVLNGVIGLLMQQLQQQPH